MTVTSSHITLHHTSFLALTKVEIDDDEDESTNSSVASSESHPPPPGSIRVSAEDVEKASQDASHPATPGKDPRGDPKIMGVTPESTMTKGESGLQSGGG